MAAGRWRAAGWLCLASAGGVQRMATPALTQYFGAPRLLNHSQAASACGTASGGLRSAAMPAPLLAARTPRKEKEMRACAVFRLLAIDRCTLLAPPAALALSMRAVA